MSSGSPTSNVPLALAYVSLDRRIRQSVMRASLSRTIEKSRPETPHRTTMIHPAMSEPADASSTAGSSCATVRQHKTCVRGQTYLGELLHCEQRAVRSAVRLAHANHYCANPRPNGCCHCDHRKNFGSEGQHPNIGQRQLNLQREVSAVPFALGRAAPIQAARPGTMASSLAPPP